jgi:hypothetical protein
LLAVILNHLKEEMINQWETLFEIQSLENVFAAPCRRVLSQALFRVDMAGAVRLL